jgi:hypothetical protein
MKTVNAIKVLNSANLSRNGYAFQSSTHRFDIFTNDGAHGKDVLFVKMSKLDGSDYDSKADYNNSINIYTLKELKQRVAQ